MLTKLKSGAKVRLFIRLSNKKLVNYLIIFFPFTIYTPWGNPSSEVLP